MMYKISFFKIAIEFFAVNIILLLFFSVEGISNQVVYTISVVINTAVAAYFIFGMHTYKVLVNTDSIVLFNFKLGAHPQKETIFFHNLRTTYFNELIGKGIRQRRIRIYNGNELKAILKPSFTGWQHTTLEQIVSNLSDKRIAVQTEYE